jgi:hypothetical protein
MPTYTLKPGHQRTFILGIARKQGEDVVIASLKGLPAHDRGALEAHFDLVQKPEEKQPAKQPDKLGNGLTVEQARQKLEASGAALPPDLTVAELEDLFNNVFATLNLEGGDKKEGQPGGEKKDATPEGGKKEGE